VENALNIVFYVSAHGYGHATRAAALIQTLLSRPGTSLHVRTQAPHRLFTEGCPGARCWTADVDAGMVQANSLDVDVGATLAAHEAFCEGFDEAVRRETAFLKEVRADRVLSDVPALASAAAHAAGLPSAAVSNFSWDWILEPYAASEPGFKPVVERYRAAYALTGTLYRLPFAGGLTAFPKVEDCPLLVRRSPLGREEARRELGLERERRPVVLVSFGGFGPGGLMPRAGEDLSDFTFIAFGPKPEGLRAAWRELPQHSTRSLLNLLPAADALISKPGYGAASEALAHRVRTLYLPREGFREADLIVEGLRRWGVCAPIPREDFSGGRWRRHLESLLAAPATWADLRLDGAEHIARRVPSLP
jgi:L-arabinokinase